MDSINYRTNIYGIIHKKGNIKDGNKNLSLTMTYLYVIPIYIFAFTNPPFLLFSMRTSNKTSKFLQRKIHLLKQKVVSKVVSMPALSLQTSMWTQCGNC